MNMFTRPQLGLVDQPAGGDEPSHKTMVGTPSTAPSESVPASNARPKASRPQPARTMVSHSNPTDTESSGADSTDGSGQTMQPQRSGKPARVRAIPDDEFAEFD